GSEPTSSIPQETRDSAMTARSLIALVSASIIQTAFLSPVFAKPPAPTADVAVEVRLIRIGLPALEGCTDSNEEVDSRCRKALLASAERGGVRLNDKEVHHFLETLQGKRSSDLMQL